MSARKRMDSELGNLPLSDKIETGCGCSTLRCVAPALPRRQFIKLAGASSLWAGLNPTREIWAGPFEGKDLSAKHLVPADKKIDSKWLKELRKRGAKEIWSGKSLESIGMPCGGIGSGQLYLCGDGTLGCWQIFNNCVSNWIPETNATYKRMEPAKPVEQGFAVFYQRENGAKQLIPLSRSGFSQIEFRGEYPIGIVRYQDPNHPVSVEMEAFSPFIPMNAVDSSLPLTFFNIKTSNTSDAPLSLRMVGWLENAVVCLQGVNHKGSRLTKYLDTADRHILFHSARPIEYSQESEEQCEVFEDFEGETWGGWLVEGNAFGSKPTAAPIAGQLPVRGFHGKGYANSFVGGDSTQGVLTSPSFTISQPFINFLVGGGLCLEPSEPNQTCIKLMVDGKEVRRGSGRDTESMTWQSWMVDDLIGKEAQIQIVDNSSTEWGHILVDRIEFAPFPKTDLPDPLELSPDFGSLALGLLGSSRSSQSVDEISLLIKGMDLIHTDTEYGLTEKKTGLLSTEPTQLNPGQTMTFTFALSWHFPNAEKGHFYSTRFSDAAAVIEYAFENHTRLMGETRLWRDTYYDSTLPYWLLDRLHSTVSTLATGTCQWWKNGRFYAYEGVTCCVGTCTHVWGYAHAHARLFPELGRNIRENQDFLPREQGGGFHPDSGLIGFRSDDKYAADGQCHCILNAYREHLLSPDQGFLERFWPRIRKALDFLIVQDGNMDGLIENSQHNTYDINFFGANTFVGSLYLAALRAGEAMAHEMGDDVYARHLHVLFQSGRKLSIERLFDGEYFIQEVDLTEHPTHQYHKGCLSDQLFGQGWAEQVGLGYLYPKESVRTALKSIWKYNWTPDIGPYNEIHKPFRWFVSPGQAGLFTCTWPKSEYLTEGVAYREEVWTGIEYQVAGHMIWESMVDEGLTMVRAVHDRYHPDFFNPYNEIECGDHYARAMASWGVFLALSGFSYHGPAGRIGFSPRLSPDNYKTAFTTAEGWGTFSQKRSGKCQTETLVLKYGHLKLSKLSFDIPEGEKVTSTFIKLNGKTVSHQQVDHNSQVQFHLLNPVELKPKDILDVVIYHT